MIAGRLLFNLNAYRQNGQVLDAVRYLIREFKLESDNFKGLEFREEADENKLLLTAEGVLGKPQTVKVPRNLFDFDLELVLNLLAHEMLHVKQKSPGNTVEDKNEREFQAYYEMLFHKIFPQIPDLGTFYKMQFAKKALEYYRRMGEGSELQNKYSTQKKEVETLVNQFKS